VKHDRFQNVALALLNGQVVVGSMIDRLQEYAKKLPSTLNALSKQIGEINFNRERSLTDDKKQREKLVEKAGLVEKSRSDSMKVWDRLTRLVQDRVHADSKDRKNVSKISEIDQNILRQREAAHDKFVTYEAQHKQLTDDVAAYKNALKQRLNQLEDMEIQRIELARRMLTTYLDFEKSVGVRLPASKSLRAMVKKLDPKTEIRAGIDAWHQSYKEPAGSALETVVMLPPPLPCASRDLEVPGRPPSGTVVVHAPPPLAQTPVAQKAVPSVAPAGAPSAAPSVAPAAAPVSTVAPATIVRSIAALAAIDDVLGI